MGLDGWFLLLQMRSGVKVLSPVPHEQPHRRSQADTDKKITTCLAIGCPCATPDTEELNRVLHACWLFVLVGRWPANAYALAALVALHKPLVFACLLPCLGYR